MAAIRANYYGGKAGAAIATAYTFVKQDNDGNIINCAAAGDIPVGVFGSW